MRIFILEDCPYCLRLKRYIKELQEEDSKYQAIPIEYINEAIEVDLANSYDYYYVPTLYDQDVKLHEGAITKEQTKELFDNYLEERK